MTAATAAGLTAAGTRRVSAVPELLRSWQAASAIASNTQRCRMPLMPSLDREDRGGIRVLRNRELRGRRGAEHVGVGRGDEDVAPRARGECARQEGRAGVGEPEALEV